MKQLKLSIKELGYQATAFKRFGIIDFEAFKANEILEVLNLEERELISLYNDFLSEINDEQYYENDDYFLNEFFRNASDAVRAVCYGDYHYNDDYAYFNGFGNLESCSAYEIAEEAESNKEFLLWIYKNYENYGDSNDELSEFIKFVNNNEKRIIDHALKLVNQGY